MAYKDKEEKRAYDREYYKKNKKKINTRRYTRCRGKRKKIRADIAEIKSAKGCCKCGEKHPACLAFHHTGDDKEINIADAVRRGWGKERILKEMEKCDIMCFNCHMKLHWYQDRDVAQLG